MTHSDRTAALRSNANLIIGAFISKQKAGAAYSIQNTRTRVVVIEDDRGILSRCPERTTLFHVKEAPLKSKGDTNVTFYSVRGSR